MTTIRVNRLIQTAEALRALADGDVIQSRMIGKDEWQDFPEPATLDLQNVEYRAKPQPTYRPFNSNELPFLAGRAVRIKGKGGYGYLILWAGPVSAKVSEIGVVNTNVLAREYEFLDGTPCGQFEPTIAE